MDYHLKQAPQKTTITCSGSFTFADNQRFRHAMNSILEQEDSKAVLDLSGVTYIDSAALGMLLLLREMLEEKNISLMLYKPKDQVAKMFEISKFNELFTIEW